jgi:hypothetical protein
VGSPCCISNVYAASCPEWSCGLTSSVCTALLPHYSSYPSASPVLSCYVALYVVLTIDALDVSSHMLPCLRIPLPVQCLPSCQPLLVCWIRGSGGLTATASIATDSDDDDSDAEETLLALAQASRPGPSAGAHRYASCQLMS